MPKSRPLKFREVIKALRSLGFVPEPQKATSHQTWILKRQNRYYAVTVFFHGRDVEFKPKTLRSIIDQSGFSVEEFYRAVKK